MKKTILYLICVFATATASANVRDLVDPYTTSNFYVDGFGGVNFINTHKKHGVKIDYNPGYVVGGSLGYRFSDAFRLEAEGAYRENTVNELAIRSMKLSGSGTVRKATAMVNGIFEFPMLEGALIPHVGFGVGESWNIEKLKYATQSDESNVTLNHRVSAKDTGVAYQGIAGLTFAMNRYFQTGLEYRYMDGSQIEGNHSIDFCVRTYF